MQSQCVCLWMHCYWTLLKLWSFVWQQFTFSKILFCGRVSRKRYFDFMYLIELHPPIVLMYLKNLQTEICMIWKILHWIQTGSPLVHEFKSQWTSSSRFEPARQSLLKWSMHWGYKLFVYPSGLCEWTSKLCIVCIYYQYHAPRRLIWTQSLKTRLFICKRRFQFCTWRTSNCVKIY